MKKIISLIISALTVASCVFPVGVSAASEDPAYDSSESIAECTFEPLLLCEAEKAEYAVPSSFTVLSADDDSSYCYGDFLDGNNLEVYNALSQWKVPSLDPVEVDLTEKIYVSLSSLPGSSDYSDDDEAIFREAVFSNCKPGIDCFMYDFPGIFWLDTSGLSVSIENASYDYDPITGIYDIEIASLCLNPALEPAFSSLDEVTEYKEKLDLAVDDFAVTGDNLYEKIKSIHDNIALFTYYDLNAPFMSSCIGSLISPGCVCEGYAEGFKFICDSLGIPCVCVFGNYNEVSNTAHMWNYVRMNDGKWYGVDLTWDDEDGEYGEEIEYDYFLKGSDDFFTSHTEEPADLYTDLNYPVLSEADYSEPAKPDEYERGDFNRDGFVNVADLVLCEKAVHGEKTLFPCDYNGDMNIDSFDAAMLRKVITSM